MTKTKTQSLDLSEEDFKFIDNFFEEYKIKEGAGFKPLISLAINKYKQRIKSACEFYLNNKADNDLDKEGLLCILEECIKLGIDKKDKRWFEEFYKKVKNLQDTDDYVIYEIDEYNEWLFKLAFKDVLEEKEEEK